MPWWSWVLIWVVLALGLLGTLAAFGWWLFRKAMTAVAALGELTGKLELLDAAREKIAEAPLVPAAVRPAAEVRSEYRENAELRADRRQKRRVRRRARGKLLVSADLRKRTFPWESSATPSGGRT